MFDKLSTISYIVAMKDIKTTATQLNKKPLTCGYPGCQTPLSRYNKGNLCSIHENAKHQAAFEEYKKVLMENALLKNKPFQAIKKTRVSFLPIYVSGSYEIVNKENQSFVARFIGKDKNIGHLYYANEIPDLFLRFAQLDIKKEEDYLPFINDYGLLGLRQIYENIGGMVEGWEDNEEPIVLIHDFKRKFERAFKWVNDYINKENKPQNDEALQSYLTNQFRNSGINLTVDLAGVLIFSTSSLANSMILQLYNYLVSGKVTKKCFLPSCDQETTNLKFCCANHQKLFVQWKRRGNIVEKNGRFIKVYKKRGRKPHGKGEEKNE